QLHRRHARRGDRRGDAVRLARAPAAVLPVQHGDLVTDLAPDTATPAPGTAAAPAEPATPAPRPIFAHPRRRQGFIGPFGGRQIVMALLLIAAVIVAIVGLTAPLGNTTALARPDPRPTP